MFVSGGNWARVLGEDYMDNKRLVHVLPYAIVVTLTRLQCHYQLLRTIDKTLDQQGTELQLVIYGYRTSNQIRFFVYKYYTEFNGIFLPNVTCLLVPIFFKKGWQVVQQRWISKNMRVTYIRLSKVAVSSFELHGRHE